MWIIFAFWAMSTVQMASSLQCYKREITFTDAREGHGSVTSLMSQDNVNCATSCHKFTSKDGEVYKISLGCDEKGPSKLGCYTQHDGSEHCTCYSDMCNKPNITNIGSEIKEKEKHLNLLKCNRFIAGLVNGEVKVSKPSVVDCANSCHVYVAKDEEGWVSVSGGCSYFGEATGSCKMVDDDTMDCDCGEKMCNSIPDVNEFDWLTENWIKTAMAREQRVCKKFEGTFNNNSGEFTFATKGIAVCHTNCTLIISKDITDSYSLNGGCQDSNEHLKHHEVTVGEKKVRRRILGLFRSRKLELTKMTCGAFSDDAGRRFLDCSCGAKVCNDPSTEEMRRLVGEYNKIFSH